MIFAAGVAKRLKPISLKTPKALVRLGDRTMLEIVASKLVRYGVKTIIVNVHHHHEQMVNFVNQLKIPGVEVLVSDESDHLLDTGGGLKKSSPLLEGSEPIILHNVDVLSDVNIGEMVAFHKKNQAMATLAVSKRETSRYFKVNQNRLVGWTNISTGEDVDSINTPANQLSLMAFSGIHVISPELLPLITEDGAFSLTKVYLRLAAKHPIYCFRHEASNWIDIGTPEKLKSAQEAFLENPSKFA